VAADTLSLCRHGLPIRVLPPATVTSDSPVTVNRSGQDISPRVYIESAGLLCSLLFGVPDVLLRKVQSMQKTAERLVTGAKRHDHITPVLQQLHWLPVRQRIEFKIACLVHQSLSGQKPTYVLADIQLAVDHGRQNLRSATDRTCFLPRTHNTFGDRSFSVAGPRVWNSLPADL